MQKKQFTHLDEMVEYYSHARRGLVCALTIPIAQRKQVEEEVTTVTYDSGTWAFRQAQSVLCGCWGVCFMWEVVLIMWLWSLYEDTVEPLNVVTLYNQDSSFSHCT